MALIIISIILSCVVESILPCTVPSRFDDITPIPPQKYIDEKQANYQCGPVPLSIYSCIDIDFVPEDIVRICRDAKPKKSMCEHTICIFRHSGWMFANDKINYKALNSTFVNFLNSHPETKGAVRHVVRKCLTPDIKPQSLFSGCPTFDMLTCSMNAFIKHASKKQWKQTPQCKGVEEFARYCPLCPSECHDTLKTVPNDVCTPCFEQNSSN